MLFLASSARSNGYHTPLSARACCRLLSAYIYTHNARAVFWSSSGLFIPVGTYRRLLVARCSVQMWMPRAFGFICGVYAARAILLVVCYVTPFIPVRADVCVCAEMDAPAFAVVSAVCTIHPRRKHISSCLLLCNAVHSGSFFACARGFGAVVVVCFGPLHQRWMPCRLHRTFVPRGCSSAEREKVVVPSGLFLVLSFFFFLSSFFLCVPLFLNCAA